MPMPGVIAATVLAAFFGSAFLYLLIFVLHRYIHRRCLEWSHYLDILSFHLFKRSKCECRGMCNRTQRRSPDYQNEKATMELQLAGRRSPPRNVCINGYRYRKEHHTSSRSRQRGREGHRLAIEYDSGKGRSRSPFGTLGRRDIETPLWTHEGRREYPILAQQEDELPIHRSMESPKAHRAQLSQQMPPAMPQSMAPVMPKPMPMQMMPPQPPTNMHYQMPASSSIPMPMAPPLSYLPGYTAMPAPAPAPGLASAPAGGAQSEPMSSQNPMTASIIAAEIQAEAASSIGQAASQAFSPRFQPRRVNMIFFADEYPPMVLEQMKQENAANATVSEASTIAGKASEMHGGDDDDEEQEEEEIPRAYIPRTAPRAATGIPDHFRYAPSGPGNGGNRYGGGGQQKRFGHRTPSNAL